MWTWLGSFMMNPFLAVGTLSIASPILIHLLSRRRHRRVRWAAMEFLLAAQKRNRRRVRLEQIILLALRCLAVFLVAMALARPFVRPGALAALGAAGRSEHVILLDDSFSMGYRSPSGAGGGQEVFTLGCRAARNIADAAGESSEADSLTLLATSRPRQPLAAIPSLNRENLRRLSGVLDGLTVTQGSADFADAMESAASAIRATPTQANVVVYVVSDFQRKDWLPVGGDESDDLGVVAPLKALVQENRSVRLVLVDVAVDESPRNLAVVDLRKTQAQVVASVPARFEAAVANYTGRTLDEVEVSIRAGEHTLAPIAIRNLAAGQVAREPFEVTFPVEGSHFIEVQLVGAARHGDGVLVDNQRIEPVEVAAALRVLLVNGEKSSDPYNDEVYLLRTALRPQGRAASGNEVDVIDEQDIEAVELTDYHVVMLANVGRVTASAARRLSTFAEAGGGIVIFAGDQVDAASYNSELYREGKGLLPAPLEGVFEAPVASGAFIGAWDAAHPVMRAFTDDLAAVLKKVNVTTYMRTGEPAAISSTAPSEGAGTDSPEATARVVARLSDPDETPLMIERAYGRGRCIFIATSADQEWNDWAASFSYLPMMLELVQYASRPAPPAAAAVVGSPLECSVDAATVQHTARLRTPQYPVEAEAPLIALLEGGRAKFRYLDTNRSGLYRFELSDPNGRPRPRYGAVYCPPAESKLARATRAELEAACEGLNVRYISDIESPAGETTAARMEIWWPLVMAAIVVFMSEHVLAWWFGRRG